MAAELCFVKQKVLIWYLLVTFFYGAEIVSYAEPVEENELDDFVESVQAEHRKVLNMYRDADWEYALHATDDNFAKKTTAVNNYNQLFQTIREKLIEFNDVNIADEDLQRKVNLYKKKGSEILLDKIKENNEIKERMKKFYNAIRVCKYESHCDCEITENDLVNIFKTNRNSEELKWYWTQWYDKAGKLNKNDFFNYVAMLNEDSIKKGFDSLAEECIAEYGENFEQQIDNIMQEFMPKYRLLHAYVRHRLRQHYGEEVPKNGPIPMHLLGNVWAQTWESVYSFTKPHENERSVNVTVEMKQQSLTAIKMYEKAANEFKTLGMPELPSTFWSKSFLTKPYDDFPCHPHAQCTWDFHRQEADVRVMQCTEVNHEELLTVYHRLGHIYYSLSYNEQPLIYQNEPCRGFQESIPDLFKLVASSPKHLKKLNLLNEFDYTENVQINQLYESALLKLPFIPFAYSIEKYRYQIYRGQIVKDTANSRFWQLRSEYAGVKPPVARDETYFDAAAKYHVPAGEEYLRYLTGTIFLFQFHESACKLAEEYVETDSEKTLENCDFFANANAGQKIKDMLKMGNSKPWPDALEALTGQREINVAPLLKYYDPLFKWLKTEIERLNIPTGWDEPEGV